MALLLGGGGWGLRTYATSSTHVDCLLVVNDTLPSTLLTFFFLHRLVLYSYKMTWKAVVAQAEHRYRNRLFRIAEYDSLTVMNGPISQPAGFEHFASFHHVQRGRKTLGIRPRTSGISDYITNHGGRLARQRRGEAHCIRDVHFCRPDIGK